MGSIFGHFRDVARLNGIAEVLEQSGASSLITGVFIYLAAFQVSKIMSKPWPQVNRELLRKKSRKLLPLV